MSSRFTMGLGAIFVGYWGLVPSHQPAPVTETVSQPAAPVAVEKVVAAAEDQTRQPIVVLVRDVPPFQFTQLALGSVSEGLARNDTVATLHPGIEVIRGHQASQQTP